MSEVIRSEHLEQRDFFDFLRKLEFGNPDIRFVYAIPNGGLRNIRVAKSLKDEGVKPGVPDICWPCPMGEFHGLYIEMKRTKLGKVSADQRVWIDWLKEKGCYVEVCKGFEEAKNVFLTYIKMGEFNDKRRVA